MEVSLLSVVFTRTEKLGEISQLLMKMVLFNSRNGQEQVSKVVLTKADDS